MKNNRIMYVIITFLGFMFVGITSLIISVGEMEIDFAPFIMAFTFFIMGVVIISVVAALRNDKQSNLEIPTCPKCNTPITSTGDYCPFCKTDLRHTSECPYCGEQNPYDEDTCQTCNGLLK